MDNYKGKRNLLNVIILFIKLANLIYWYYSVGNVSFAGKTPPSKHVPSGPLNKNRKNCIQYFNYLTHRITYTIKHSHSKNCSSVIGPATIPSGGLSVNSVCAREINNTSINYTLTVWMVIAQTYVCIQPLDGEGLNRPLFIW